MLGKHAEAIQDCDRALELDNGRDRDTIRLTRAEILARAGDYARALKEANDLAQAKSLSGSALYSLAGVYSLSSLALQRAATSSQPDAKQSAEQTASRAVALLAKARDIGFFQDPSKVEQMKADAYLDTLRQRDDFRKLEAALKGTAPQNKSKNAKETGERGKGTS